MRLWLVRHAAPVLAPGLCYGRSDVPADRAATAVAAERLHRALPEVVVWHVSPLTRTRQLADAMRRWRPGAQPPTVDERLAEFDFGTWELQPWDGVPRHELDAWAADFADYRPGGGESVRELLRRVRCALAPLLQPSAPADHVWITHAGVIRAAQYLRMHGDAAVPRSADEWPAHAPGHGDWLCLPGA